MTGDARVGRSTYASPGDCTSVEIETPDPPAVSTDVVVLREVDGEWEMIDIRNDDLIYPDPGADNCGY